MKKILFFTESYARGGGNRYMIDLLNAVVDDFDEAVIASNRGGVLIDDKQRLKTDAQDRDVGFITRNRIDHVFRSWPMFLRRIIVLSSMFVEPLLFFINVLIFIRLLKQENPLTVVSCNGGYPASQACLALCVAANQLSIPVTLSIVSTPTPRRKILYLYDKIVDKLVWSSVNVVIVNAKSIAKELENRREMPNKLVHVIYNGIEHKERVYSEKIRDKFVLGYVARLDKNKGCLVLLEAFRLLAKKYSDIRLVFAGSGDSSDELHHRVNELGLGDKVEMLGHYSGDINSLLGTFDTFVFPSFWEGFPYSIIEAMRSGCVIVSTNVGGIAEAINDGDDGILVQPNSAQEIVDAVDRVRNSPELKNRLSVNARDKYEREYLLTTMHERVRKLLRELYI